MKKQKATETKPGKKKWKIFLGVVLGLVIVLSCLAVYGGYRAANSVVNLPNLSYCGIDVGRMTKQETAEALRKAGTDRLAETPLRVTLPLHSSLEIDRMKAGAVLLADDAAEAIFQFGHSGNWVADLSAYLHALFVPQNLTAAEYALNEPYLAEKIHAAGKQLRENTADTEIHVMIRPEPAETEENEAEAEETDTEEREEKEEVFQPMIRLQKGAGELMLNEDGLLTAIKKALIANEQEIVYNELQGSLRMPDFQALYESLYAEPQDAEYDDAFQVIDETVGCSFPVDEAESLWTKAEPLAIVEIPLEVTMPAVTGDELRARLYRDLLGTRTTEFQWSSDNRIRNIQLAAEKLNGLILMPGEMLSYNEAVGQRTTEAGFLPAAAYADGDVVEEVGGGICQVSSTLYCASMLAQLTTVSRACHYFRVSYLPMGYDATVSWTKPDLKIRNDRTYPVKIQTDVNVDARSLTVSFLGTDEDGSYAELDNHWFDIFDEEYTTVSIGWGCNTYINIFDASGNLIQTIEQPYSVYYKHPEDIEWPEEKLEADARAALEQALANGTAVIVG